MSGFSDVQLDTLRLLDIARVSALRTDTWIRARGKRTIEQLTPAECTRMRKELTDGK